MLLIELVSCWLKWFLRLSPGWCQPNWRRDATVSSHPIKQNNNLRPPNLCSLMFNVSPLAHKKTFSVAIATAEKSFLNSNPRNNHATAYMHIHAHWPNPQDLETAGGWHQGSFLLVARQGQRSCPNNLRIETAKPVHIQPTIKSNKPGDCSKCKYARQVLTRMHSNTYTEGFFAGGSSRFAWKDACKK